MKLSYGAQTAIEKLNSCGFEAYVVGGCVRDSIMGIVPHDFDMTTNALPEEIIDCFKDYRCLTVGIKHGTVTVIINEEQIEITTYRIDGEYKDSRHPESVTFSNKLSDDTSRRDFTVNAIAFSPNNGYMDHHNGAEDIKNKIIRCVGEPYKRFTEDALRIIRALRFASVLGFKIEENTSKAIHELKHLLKDIAIERIFIEFTKLICGKNAKNILIEYSDVISIFIPEIIPMIGFEQNNPHHCYDVYMHTLVSLENIENDPALRWTMLLHDIGKPHCYSEDEKGGHFYGHYKISADISESILKRMKASNDFIKLICTLVYRHDAVIPITEKSVKRLLMKVGADNAKLLFKINRADALAQANHQINDRLERFRQLEELTEEIIAKDECFTLSSMAVNGNDLLSAGLPRGKNIGVILKTLLNEVIENKTKNTKADLIKRAKEINAKIIL